MPYSEMDNSTLALLHLISQRARKECYNILGRDRVSSMDGVLTHCRPMSEFC